MWFKSSKKEEVFPRVVHWRESKYAVEIARNEFYNKVLGRGIIVRSDAILTSDYLYDTWCEAYADMSSMCLVSERKET